MAADAHAAQTDRDLTSRAERARPPGKQAGVELGDFSEHNLRIADAVDRMKRLVSSVRW